MHQSGTSNKSQLISYTMLHVNVTHFFAEILSDHDTKVFFSRVSNLESTTFSYFCKKTLINYFCSFIFVKKSLHSPLFNLICC